MSKKVAPKKLVSRKSKLDSIIQLLIPPSLVLLLTVTIIELFYGVGKGMAIFIDIFDIYVIAIFAIDLYYRWFETPHFWPYLKKHFLDIIATIPFNLIFLGIEGLVLIRALRGVKILARAARFAKFARYGRLLRLVRFGARAPRFIRTRKYVKETKIRKVQPHEKELKKTLSFKVILLITINSIMGTGIWFLTSAGAKEAGPASLVSWGILSGISIYIAACFGELVSMFPKAGGVYEFAKQTYGRFWSFVIGWTTSIAGSVTIAMLLLGALQYLIPIQYASWYIPLAILMILLFSYIAFRGMQTSTYVLVTFALITLAAVIAIIIPGFFRFKPENFDPFFVFPSLSIALAIFFIAETFFGWESAIFLAAETKNPKKIMPKALIWGTVVIAILSFLLALTAMGTIPWQDYSASVAPLKDLGNIHYGQYGGIAFAILIFISVIGATAGWIVTAPRLLMSIAEDKLFFTQFAKIHPKHKSPYVSIIFQIVVVSALVIVGAGSYETLLHMLIPLILIVYSAVLMSVVILRFKKPDLDRPFRVPFGKVGPFITMLFMVFLLIMFIFKTHGALDILRVSVGLIAFGIPAYFAIELFYDQKYVIIRQNFMAKLRHYSPRIFFPKLAYKRIIRELGNTNSKSIIVDYNSPLAGFTRRLLQDKQKYKKLYILNSSKAAIGIIKESKYPKSEVKFNKSGNIPIKGVDLFVSFNDLGLLNIEKFVAAVAKSLVKGGKYCFYTKQHFMNMMPNAVELDNKKELEKTFKKYKLKMNYKRVKVPGREEIFIYGKK
jgi:basic amino acid/polyamine antiporter, APA family